MNASEAGAVSKTVWAEAEAATLYREAATLSDGQGERRCLLGEAGRLTRPIRRRDL
ncbi:hypothetical protein [Streptomyces sp. NPDC055107]